MFIMLFAFTVSLFYLSRCQKSSRLTNQDDSVLISKESSQNKLPKPDRNLSTQEYSQNKIEPLRSTNKADETLYAHPSEKEVPGEKISKIDDLKSSPGDASNPGVTAVRPESSPDPSEQKVVIYFSTDSTGLTGDALEKLKMIYGFLLNRPDLELIIEGYGDSDTNSQINEKLSQFRAEIVKSYFVKQGVSSSKIKVFWMGMQKPDGEDEPQEKEDKNHQVEIQFKSKSKSDPKN
jgi:outer membrane protein OmpA-like peptidoglycan-associated protein